MGFRLLIDRALDGPANMGRDEALLESVARGDAPPTLRFYGWSPPTISLGYFQDFSEFEALPAPAGHLAVVRRQTGGGAILHDLELTYSLTVPSGHTFIAGNAAKMYAVVHDAAARVLRALGVPVESPSSGNGSAVSGCSQRGPFFCFERHGAIDLLAGGEKIMGSAQRRTTGAVLQHGSLILDSRYPQQRCATVARFANVDAQTLACRLAAAITGAECSPSAFLAAELRRADELRLKYAGSAWTSGQR